jgi:hypothetical protein
MFCCGDISTASWRAGTIRNSVLELLPSASKDKKISYNNMTCYAHDITDKKSRFELNNIYSLIHLKEL